MYGVVSIAVLCCCVNADEYGIRPSDECILEYLKEKGKLENHFNFSPRQIYLFCGLMIAITLESLREHLDEMFKE